MNIHIMFHNIHTQCLNRSKSLLFFSNLIDSSPDNSNLIYEREKLMTESQSQNLIQLLSVGINSGVLLFCGIFVLMIKQKNDSKELCERYEFYEKMGMEENKRKKNINKESYIFTSAAFVSGGMIGILFALVEIFRKHMEIQYLFAYITGITGITGSFCAASADKTGTAARIPHEGEGRDDQPVHRPGVPAGPKAHA